MKHFVKTFCLILVLAFFANYTVTADNTTVDSDILIKASSSLSQLGIMKGDTQGNLNLEQNITRSQFITLIVRIMGYDNDKNLNDVVMNFNDNGDIQNWAYDYMRLGLKYNLIKGYNDNTVRPEAYVSSIEAQAIILRALGYGWATQNNWPHDVIAQTKILGLNNDLYFTDDHILTRGETSVLIYNSLTTAFYSGNR